MILDWAIYGAITWGLATLLNRMAFANAPASGFVAWALTALFFVVSLVALTALQYERYRMLSDSLGYSIRPQNFLDMAGAFTFSWVFFSLLRRRPKAVSTNKQQQSKTANRFSWRRLNASSIGNEAYAAALQEIEEGLHDKGLWGRSLAESGGDEKMAQAAYIKGRARQIHEHESANAATPPATEVGVVPAIPVATSKWAMQTTLAMAGAAVIGIIAAVALPAYQDYTRRQEAAVTPMVSTQTGEPRGAYVAKVTALEQKAKQGQLLSMIGSASFAPPEGRMQWSGPDTQVLESGQTWWRNKGTEFHMHVNNTTRLDVIAVGLDYGDQGCGVSPNVRRFFVLFARPIAAGSQALVDFKPEIAVGDSPRNCLTISSAWESSAIAPVGSLPGARNLKPSNANLNNNAGPNQPAVPRVASISESAQGRAYSAQEKADLDAVSARALSDYPYLDTPAG